MRTLFLSASVPIPGRGDYHETADPFLIQLAVRELFIATRSEWHVIWGGHPAITPMVWAVCSDLGVDYSKAVTLYQSRYFEGNFPQESTAFENLVIVDHVPGDRTASIAKMRETMLGHSDLAAAVFVGGMEGVEIEYEMFRDRLPSAPVLPLAAPGGASRRIAERFDARETARLSTVDFAALFYATLGA